jgi:hypothetical protein
MLLLIKSSLNSSRSLRRYSFCFSRARLRLQMAQRSVGVAARHSKTVPQSTHVTVIFAACTTFCTDFEYFADLAFIALQGSQKFSSVSLSKMSPQRWQQ